MKFHCSPKSRAVTYAALVLNTSYLSPTRRMADRRLGMLYDIGRRMTSEELLNPATILQDCVQNAKTKVGSNCRLKSARTNK
jgi:hypothetical protein